MITDFNKFKEILLGYVKVKKSLPNIAFKYTTTLNNIVQKLCGSATFYSAKLGLNSNITKMITDVTERMQSDAITKQAFDELSEISNGFVDKIQSTRDILATVKTTVTSLESQINEQYRQISKHVTLLNTSAGVEPDESVYDKMDWNDILLAGPQTNVIRMVHDQFAISDDKPGRIYFSRVLVGLGNLGRIQKVELSPEDKAKVVDALDAALPNVLVDDVRKAFSLLTDPAKFSTMAGKVSAALQMKGKVGDNIINIFWYLRNLLPLMDKIDMGVGELSDATLSKIKDNMKKADTVLRYGAYFAITMREGMKVNGTILLDNKMINPDTFDDFKAKGGTITNIVNHVNYMYSTGTIPFLGISGESVMAMADKFAKRAEKEVAQLAVKIKYEKNRALKSSMQIVLREYLKEANAQKNLSVGNEQVVSRIAEQQIVNDPPLKDLLYNFVIGTQYPDSFVKRLMNNLGNAYVQRLANTVSINDQDVQLAEASVYTDMVVSFIVDNFLVNLGVIDDIDSAE